MDTMSSPVQAYMRPPTEYELERIRALPKVKSAVYYERDKQLVVRTRRIWRGSLRTLTSWHHCTPFKALWLMIVPPSYVLIPHSRYQSNILFMCGARNMYECFGELHSHLVSAYEECDYVLLITLAMQFLQTGRR